MLDITKQAAENFEKTTGISPKSVKSNKGSMRSFITVTLDANDPTVKEFADDFYTPDGTRFLNGIRVTYMNSEYKGKRSFEIAKADILTIQERALEIANQ